METEARSTDQIMDDNASSDTSLSAVMKRWISRLRHLSSELLELAELEMKLVALSFIEMLILSAIGILFIITAWLALMVSGIFFLAEQGFSWPAALLIASAINGLLGILCMMGIYRLNNNICFKTFRLLLDAYEKQDGKKTENSTNAVIRDAQIEP
jgi:hypothetical protein